MTLSTPTAVLSEIAEAASPWPTPKRLAISQALMPVGTDEVSTSAAVQSALSPRTRQASQTQAGISSSLRAEITVAMPTFPWMPYLLSAMPSEISAAGAAMAVI
ncbi:hypothetical protein D3C72_2247610 [compost metagenome]